MYARFVRRIPRLLALVVLIALIPLRTAESQSPCILNVGNCSPTPNPTVDPGRGTRTFEGTIAQEILQAQNSGSRYMVVLQKYWDPNQNCWVEERAWVGGVMASGSGRVVAPVSQSRAVCVQTNTLSTPQVNQAETYLQTARNDLAAWLAYQQQVPVYFNGQYDAWARQEYARTTAWINYYRQYIAVLEARIAGIAP
jgi:hypothetical protein